jgi:hypothetical protein
MVRDLHDFESSDEVFRTKASSRGRLTAAALA